MKPDLVAPGTHIQGIASHADAYAGAMVCDPYWPVDQVFYTWASGTSQAAPSVAGACALVRQKFVNEGRPAPSPAMTKAMLVAGASYLSGFGGNDSLWSNSQGMGRVNLGRTLGAPQKFLLDQTQVFGSTGESYTQAGVISPSTGSFRVVLAWTDAPGNTTGNAYVNDLDLRVEVNGTLYIGNVFSGALSATGGSPDPRNNVESVFLPAGVKGSYRVTIRATNIAGDGVPGNADLTDQDFALLVFNGTPFSTSPHHR